MLRRLWILGLSIAAAGCASSAPQERGADTGDVAPAASEERTTAAKVEAALERGRELEKAGRLDAAEGIYREALSRDDVGREQRGTLHLRLARLMAEAGQTGNAVEHAHEAHRLRPDWNDAAEFAERVQQRWEKEEAAAKGRKKDPHAGQGDLAERLARLEKMLAALAEKFEAGGAKQKHAVSDGARQEEEMLRKKLAEMKDAAHRTETERSELKARVKALEAEAAGLREEVAALREKLSGAK